MDIPENDFTYGRQKEVKVVKLNNSLPSQLPPSPPPASMQSKIMRNPNKPNSLTYDDILNNMGMCVVDGKLHFIGEYTKKNTPLQPQQAQRKQQFAEKVPIEVAPQNSYIYNKYFKNEFKEDHEIKIPKTALEYRNMLIQQIFEKERNKRVKSKQLFVTNIDNTIAHAPKMSEAQLNKLFSFSNPPLR
jgi:hypothetical protein